MYQLNPVKLVFKSCFLTEESSYFLGGIFSAYEKVRANGKTYWCCPFRYNAGQVSRTDVENHLSRIKDIAINNGGIVRTFESVRNTALDSGRNRNRPGFCVFFEAENDEDVSAYVSQLLMSLKMSSISVLKAFVMGMYDGRGSFDINLKTHSFRYFSLDCANPELAEFFKKILDLTGLQYNYNESRDRKNGGAPRKPQLRLKNVTNYLKTIGLISPGKIEQATLTMRLAGLHPHVVRDDSFIVGCDKIY